MIETPKVVADTLAWLRAVAPSVFAERRDLRLDSRQVGRGDVFLVAMLVFGVTSLALVAVRILCGEFDEADLAAGVDRLAGEAG